MLGPFGVPPLLVQVVVAIATGGLIGLERERLPERKYAGLRTLALLCGAGPIVVYAGRLEEGQTLLVAFLAIYREIGRVPRGSTPRVKAVKV